MAEVILPSHFQKRIDGLNAEITALNNEKVKIILKQLDIYPGDELFAVMLDWKLIAVTVSDRQMGIQLNGLCSYVPNLKFVVDVNRTLFNILEGRVGRRVWKER